MRSESPDKEVNQRPTSPKKFRADALRGPRVSTATGVYIIIIIIIIRQYYTGDESMYWSQAGAV